MNSIDGSNGADKTDLNREDPNTDRRQVEPPVASSNSPIYYERNVQLSGDSWKYFYAP